MLAQQLFKPEDPCVRVGHPAAILSTRREQETAVTPLPIYNPNLNLNQRSRDRKQQSPISLLAISSNSNMQDAMHRYAGHLVEHRGDI